MNANRREFLKKTGALGVCSALSGLEPLLSAMPLPARRRPVLVLIFLRGGCDGLHLVAPYADPDYVRLRQHLAIPRPGPENGAVDLDGFFGLHPGCAPLLPFFSRGDGVALHAVGYPGNSRSHFEEQDVWETCTLEDTVSADGWLNRHLQTSSGDGPVRAIALGNVLPRILRGDARSIALRALAEIAVEEGDAASRPWVPALESAYRGSPGRVAGTGQERFLRSGRDALEAMRELEAVARQPYGSGESYPRTELGGRLRDAARLIRSDVGLELVVLDYGGWDTHQNQQGQFQQLAAQLAGGIAAFLQDLDDRLDDLLLLTVSEFGRTAALNGTSGTDHGWGNCMLAFGGPVRRKSGGQPRGVLGDWPGLAPDQLWQWRDLAHTTDFRDVFAEVAGIHLENDSIEALLPGHICTPIGLIA